MMMMNNSCCPYVSRWHHRCRQRSISDGWISLLITSQQQWQNELLAVTSYCLDIHWDLFDSNSSDRII